MPRTAPTLTASITAVASVLHDGRSHLVVTHHDRALNDYNPAHYTTVGNIDGSNRFMADDSYWSFLPSETLRHPAVIAALDTLPKQSDLHVNAYHWDRSVRGGAPSFA